MNKDLELKCEMVFKNDAVEGDETEYCFVTGHECPYAPTGRYEYCRNYALHQFLKKQNQFTKKGFFDRRSASQGG